jgi:tRNA(Leu) C34 or U34 (ribose-2'-O)-methylase TrmL
MQSFQDFCSSLPSFLPYGSIKTCINAWINTQGDLFTFSLSELPNFQIQHPAAIACILQHISSAHSHLLDDQALDAIILPVLSNPQTYHINLELLQDIADVIVDNNSWQWAHSFAASFVVRSSSGGATDDNDPQEVIFTINLLAFIIQGALQHTTIMNDTASFPHHHHHHHQKYTAFLSIAHGSVLGASLYLLCRLQQTTTPTSVKKTNNNSSKRGNTVIYTNHQRDRYIQAALGQNLIPAAVQAAEAAHQLQPALLKIWHRACTMAGNADGGGPQRRLGLALLVQFLEPMLADSSIVDVLAHDDGTGSTTKSHIKSSSSTSSSLLRVLLMHCLNDEETSNRKRSLHILQTITAHYDIDVARKILLDTNDTGLVLGTSSSFREAWAAYISFMDAIEDDSVHLIRDALPSIDIIHTNTDSNRHYLDTNLSPLSCQLSFGWMELLWKKGLHHRSPLVQKMLVSTFFSRHWGREYLESIPPSFVIEGLLPASAGVGVSGVSGGHGEQLNSDSTQWVVRYFDTLFCLLSERGQGEERAWILVNLLLKVLQNREQSRLIMGQGADMIMAIAVYLQQHPDKIHAILLSTKNTNTCSIITKKQFLLVEEIRASCVSVLYLGSGHMAIDAFLSLLLLGKVCVPLHQQQEDVMMMKMMMMEVGRVLSMLPLPLIQPGGLLREGAMQWIGGIRPGNIAQLVEHYLNMHGDDDFGISDSDTGSSIIARLLLLAPFNTHETEAHGSGMKASVGLVKDALYHLQDKVINAAAALAAIDDDGATHKGQRLILLLKELLHVSLPSDHQRWPVSDNNEPVLMPLQSYLASFVEQHRSSITAVGGAVVKMLLAKKKNSSTFLPDSGRQTVHLVIGVWCESLCARLLIHMHCSHHHYNHHGEGGGEGEEKQAMDAYRYAIITHLASLTQQHNNGLSIVITERTNDDGSDGGMGTCCLLLQAISRLADGLLTTRNLKEEEEEEEEDRDIDGGAIESGEEVTHAITMVIKSLQSARQFYINRPPPTSTTAGTTAAVKAGKKQLNVLEWHSMLCWQALTKLTTAITNNNSNKINAADGFPFVLTKAAVFRAAVCEIERAAEQTFPWALRCIRLILPLAIYHPQVFLLAINHNTNNEADDDTVLLNELCMAVYRPVIKCCTAAKILRRRTYFTATVLTACLPLDLFLLTSSSPRPSKSKFTAVEWFLGEIINKVSTKSFKIMSLTSLHFCGILAAVPTAALQYTHILVQTVMFGVDSGNLTTAGQHGEVALNTEIAEDLGALIKHSHNNGNEEEELSYSEAGPRVAAISLLSDWAHQVHQSYHYSYTSNSNCNRNSNAALLEVMKQVCHRTWQELMSQVNNRESEVGQCRYLFGGKIHRKKVRVWQALCALAPSISSSNGDGTVEALRDVLKSLECADAANVKNYQERIAVYFLTSPPLSTSNTGSRDGDGVFEEMILSRLSDTTAHQSATEGLASILLIASQTLLLLYHQIKKNNDAAAEEEGEERARWKGRVVSFMRLIAPRTASFVHSTRALSQVVMSYMAYAHPWLMTEVDGTLTSLLEFFAVNKDIVKIRSIVVKHNDDDNDDDDATKTDMVLCHEGKRDILVSLQGIYCKPKNAPPVAASNMSPYFEACPQSLLEAIQVFLQEQRMKTQAEMMQQWEDTTTKELLSEYGNSSSSSKVVAISSEVERETIQHPPTTNDIDASCEKDAPTTGGRGFRQKKVTPLERALSAVNPWPAVLGITSLRQAGGNSNSRGNNKRRGGGQNTDGYDDEQELMMLEMASLVTPSSTTRDTNGFNSTNGISLNPHQCQHHRQDLIVVASLLDKPANLGGLARSCEILGAAELILPDLTIISDPIFQSLCVTADMWVPMREVPPTALTAWLRAKAQEGYTLVGLEQTAESTPLQEYEFRNSKTVLVVGKEREGIPADVLNVLHDTVEIPQLGVIRSLNVHVSGAISMWEYTRRQLWRER